MVLNIMLFLAVKKEQSTYLSRVIVRTGHTLCLRYIRLVVDRVLGPVLAQGSTATGSLTRRVKPERLARPGKMGMTTSTIIAKKGLYMNIRLCADRVRCQPVVSMVTE